MDLAEKLEILADSAKYDVACTSSGVERAGKHGTGQLRTGGHLPRFHGGRAVRLPPEGALLQRVQLRLQLLRQPPLQRQSPRDLHPAGTGGADHWLLPPQLHRGLFLSSAVLGTPDRTMELMIEALRILREEFRFNGYIHAKTIPGADPLLVQRIGRLADRLSVNIELPSEVSLNQLAPDKKKTAILRPMGQIAVQSAQSKGDAGGTAGPTPVLRRLGKAPK